MSNPHLDAREFTGLGRTQMHDAAIEAGLVPTPELEPTVDEHNLEQQQLAASLSAAGPVAVHGGKSLDELDDLEDRVDEDVLRRLKQRKLKELKQANSLAKAASAAIKEIDDLQFDVEVRQASLHHGVVLLLFAPNVAECRIVEQMITNIKQRFHHVSFLKLKASDRILNFPITDCPTVLVYANGAKVGQFVKLAAFAGPWTNEQMIEYELGKLGILESTVKDNPYDDILEDQRQQRMKVQRKGAGGRVVNIARDLSSSEDDLE